MQTFTFANQKGGVGKTTLAVHFALWHAREKRRVLFIDMDRQANSTSSLRKRDDVKIAGEAAHLFSPDPIAPYESMPGITLIAGSEPLQDVERSGGDKPTVEEIIRPRKKIAAVAERFDICVIDTPPVLGKIVLGAIIAADYVVTPMDLSPYAVSGLQQLIRTVQAMAQNPKIPTNVQFLAIIANLVDTRAAIDKDTINDLYKHYAQFMVGSPIIRRACFKEAAGTGEAVWEMKSSTARSAAKDVEGVIEKITEKVTTGAAA